MSEENNVARSTGEELTYNIRITLIIVMPIGIAAFLIRKKEFLKTEEFMRKYGTVYD